MSEKLKVGIVNPHELDLRTINRDQTPHVFHEAEEVQFQDHVERGKITPHGLPTTLIEEPEHKLDIKA